jgi:hypothetical protein
MIRDMKKYFRLSALITVISALFVGALGSGLWELLFKPLLVWISAFFLNIATLGINSLRDDLYVEIARGLYERSGLYSVWLLTGLIVTLLSLFPICFVILFPVFIRRRLRSINLIRASSGADGSLGSFREVFRQLRWATIFLIAVIGIEIGVLLVVLARASYIAGGAIYLDQTQRIIAPFISSEERVLFASRAAQMKSKTDFEVLDRDLTRIARMNQVEVPKFSPF